MSNTGTQRIRRLVAMVLVAASFGSMQFALGQNPIANMAPSGLIPMLGTEPFPTSSPVASPRSPINPQAHAPLARLIENPDQTSGAPPYALTDQNGTIRRYVEPVNGIDLATYVGQVVVVRHDTGSTLLASQIELPPKPLYPMMATRGQDRYAIAGGGAPPSRRTDDSRGTIEQVQYVDNDDASVQLLPDEMSMSGANAMGSSSFMPMEGMGPSGNYPVYADQMGPPGMEMYGGPNQQPMPMMPYGPGNVMPYQGQMMGPCPNCGSCQNGPANNGCGGPPCTDLPCDRAQISGDVEFMLLRPNIAENAMGTFSEEYQFSPRFILSLRGVGNLDGRVRYWHYDRDTGIVGTGDDVGIHFDVLDIEALHRFAGRRSEITLAAGLRLARIKLTDVDDEKAISDLIGLTLAADGVTPLVYFPCGHFGWVYGGRISILGGDWGANNSAFLDQDTHSDNVLVHELYGGVELQRRFRVLNVHARLLFEMQNWKSDALAESTAKIESIGFFGPAVQIGAEF